MGMNDDCSALCLPLAAAGDVISLGRDAAASVLLLPQEVLPFCLVTHRLLG